MINIRAKGQDGEREVADELNYIINRILKEAGQPIPGTPIVQRNQNQSAVGGNDLSNTFGLSIEVKRQEQLSIGTWWRQCVKAAEQNSEHPVLLYRQNRKPWKCVTWVHLPVPAAGGNGGATMTHVVAEINWEQFKHWFETWVRIKVMNGEMPRV